MYPPFYSIAQASSVLEFGSSSVRFGYRRIGKGASDLVEYTTGKL
jgi:hypothetical protein